MNNATRLDWLSKLDRLAVRFGDNRVSVILRQVVLIRSSALRTDPGSYRLWDRYRKASNRLRTWTEEWFIAGYYP